MTKAFLHGGDIASAMKLAQEAGFDAGKPCDWLDLSTGINPNPYPLPDLSGKIWHRLPGGQETAALIEAAAQYYGAKDADHLIAASGSTPIVGMLPALFPGKAVSIVSPTYGDHETAWARAGSAVRPIRSLDEAEPAALALVVNPNNPDGRYYGAKLLADLAGRQTRAGGFLIVDEAFGDTAPSFSAVPLTSECNVIVLKSFGKFFGLAGLRLGFAIARPALVREMAAMLGSWAVSGPALAVGARALADRHWQAETREDLEVRSRSLCRMLREAGHPVHGGTPLFCLVDSPVAGDVFRNLLRRKIYVRRFDYNPRWLRIGLPANEEESARLREALSTR